MTSGKRFNYVVLMIGALSGISFSFIDSTFFDGGSHLVAKTLIGGSIFSAFLCLLLDTNKRSLKKLDFSWYFFDFTRPFNSLFIIGITFLLAGIVCFLILFLQSKHLIMAGYLIGFGLSLVSGSLLYIFVSNKALRNKIRS